MQAGLFDTPLSSASLEEAILYALGDFQSRGHRLADRELALDRLLHAVLRACDKLGLEAHSDEAIASSFTKIGATVVQIPGFFAKHPYRITVPLPLASTALTVYHQINDRLT